jgi:hypothetical protein
VVVSAQTFSRWKTFTRVTREQRIVEQWDKDAVILKFFEATGIRLPLNFPTLAEHVFSPYTEQEKNRTGTSLPQDEKGVVFCLFQKHIRLSHRWGSVAVISVEWALTHLPLPFWLVEHVPRKCIGGLSWYAPPAKVWALTHEQSTNAYRTS